MGYAAEGVIAACEQPECAATANTGETAEHVVVDVITGSSEDEGIVIVVVDAYGVYENFGTFENILHLRGSGVTLRIKAIGHEQ